MNSPTLEEVLDRAQREGWTRLAVCGEEWRAQGLRDRGWAEPYLVVAHEPIGAPEDLVARLAEIKSLRELVVADLGIGDNGAQAIAERLTSLTSLDLANNNIGEAGAQAIAERLTSLTSLDLSQSIIGDAGALAIAERLTSLTSLYLWNSGIGEAGTRAITERLTSLTSLTLAFNIIGDAGVQAIAERLTSLTSLNLVNIPIGDAGARVIAERLTSLTSLDLGQNNIGIAGARAIAERLTSLTSLNLMNNNIGDAGARTIAERLTSLTSLNLMNTNIGHAGVQAIAERLTSLTSLNLAVNNIGDAEAQAIAEGMTSLTSLDLEINDLQALPQALRGLPRLSYLSVSDNPRLNLPPEIAESTDAKVILAWYFNRKKRRLNEAKVLMVGQGGVGKTSLVSAALHNRKADPDERKTEKIRIDTWTIPSRHPEETLRVNIWDFGGQEIMHATHQFFLTKRSVYVLVIDARQGEIESNIHYWLQTIQSFGGDSPVLIVTNKCDVQPLSLNETGLLRQYAPMQMTFHSVSCTTLQGIDAVREALAGAIRGLAHVDDELPETYFGVKAALEKIALERQYVDMADYTRLCNERDVHDEREQRRLLRFLHDLGTVLNFDDAESPYQVGDTNILNPEWVTEGVYAIINNQPLMQARGVLELKRLPEVLKDAARYPRDKQRFIVDMMRKFELCFDFAGRPGTLLVPELLSKNEIDVNWKDAKDCLAFEYAYAVLPSGLLPRFIVRMHHALTANPTYWRSGVLLEIEGCKVLVRGDGRANVVRVSVDGPGETRRSALAAVRNEFKAIHATMPRPAVEERVPLPDAPAVAVPYAHLLELEELSRTEPAADKFFPQGLPKGAMRTYSARELLLGVEGARVRAVSSATSIAPAEPKPAPPPASEAREPRRADLKHLAGLTFLLLVVVGGVAAAIIAELRSLDDWWSRGLALTATVVMAVLLFVTLAFFSGLLKGTSFERLVLAVLSKVSPLGQPGGSEANAEEAPAEPARRKAAPKEPKALPPAKRTRAPEATEPDGASGGEAPAGKPERPPRAAKRRH